MRIQLYIIFVLILRAKFSFACLNTYQFKIFPVGIDHAKIVTVDFQIRRTSEYEGNAEYKLNLAKASPGKEMWILKSFLSTYNKKQKLISSIPLDSGFVIGADYTDTLNKIYNLAFQNILGSFPSIELFTPEYISFCDFQQKCNLVSIAHDNIADKDYLIYKSKRYLIDIIKDFGYYGFGGSAYFSDKISGYCINSVRIYKSKSVTLVLPHLASGDALSMGWITSDPKKVKNTEEGSVRLAKEYTPSVEFKDIGKSAYIEPVLGHGFGFDIFITK